MNGDRREMSQDQTHVFIMLSPVFAGVHKSSLPLSFLHQSWSVYISLSFHSRMLHKKNSHAAADGGSSHQQILQVQILRQLQF